jgi:hypothetical protein
MQCSKCGNENRENLPACPECGEALEPQAAPPSQQPESATAPQYAGFTERSLALLCDLFVAAILFLPPMALILITGQSAEWGPILFFAVLILYMTAAQYFFHTTVGKRLFGLQIRTAAKARPYPDLLELVFRESAGKFFCQCWGGLGFLAATYDSLHMTWADRLAGTVVVKALPVSRTMKIVRVLLLVFAGLLSGLLLLGLMYGA